MKLDQLKAFYIVARTGSFTRAAEEMNVDQSSVSRKIIDLESRMKARLFIRLARGLMLTREGEELLERARKILNEVESLRSFSERDANPSGLLKIATTNALSSMTLIDYVPGFLETYPEMEIALIANDQELDLTVREADVAIRPYIANAEGLCQKYLMTFHFYLYASPNYLKKHGTPRCAEDLKEHRLICFGDRKDRPFANVNWILRVGLPFGKSHKPFMQANTSHCLIRAAQLDMGIIAFSEETPLLQQSGLVKILPEIKGPDIDIFYVYPQDLESSKFITCFRDYLDKHISPEYRPKLSAV